MQRQTVLTSAEWGGFQTGLWGRLTLLLFAATVFAVVLPVGVDYPIFAGAARAWLAGDSLLFDTQSLGFFYAPWSMIIFVPLSFLPDSLGSALINAASFAAMFLAVRLLIWQVPWYAIVIPVANIWTANLIGSAQWDALITAAVALAFYAVKQRRPWLLGAALSFIGIKPTNAWLPILLIAALMLQTRWAWRSWLQAATIPALVLLASFAISGWGWPLRYLDFVAAHPPNAGYNASFFKLRGAGFLPIGMALSAAFCAALALFITIKRRGIDGLAVAIGLVLNLMISPYVTIYHYVAMIPAAAWLGKRDVLYLVALYVASVAWVIVRPSGPWLLPLYPLAVSLSLLISCLNDMPGSLPASS